MMQERVGGRVGGGHDLDVEALEQSVRGRNSGELKLGGDLVVDVAGPIRPSACLSTPKTETSSWFSHMPVGVPRNR